VSFSRPADYFAEMVKSDEHMGKIKQKLIDEAAGKKASAEARKQRDLKKFGKQVQVAKMQERAKEKRDTMEQINLLKRSTSILLSTIPSQCMLTVRRTPGRRHHKDQRGRPLRHWPRGRRLQARSPRSTSRWRQAPEEGRKVRLRRQEATR
jgi:hypothetical protein